MGARDGGHVIRAWFHVHQEAWMAFWVGFAVGLLWFRFVLLKRP